MRSVANVMILTAAMAAMPCAAIARDDAQAWQAATVNVDLGSGFRASNEIVARSSDRRGFYEIEDNLMVGYKANKVVTVWLGYTHNPQYDHGDFTVMEHRFRQQVNFDNVATVGNVRLSGRLRLEERWRDGQNGTAWRLRPQVKAALPLKSGSRTALVMTHESFIDLNTNTFQRVGGEERMRNFIGISTPLSKKITLEGGYLLQHGFVRNGPDNHDHVFSLALNGNF
ncbi:DUF2490 domain-containing protein [Novosphingobium sp. KCTC 2891]|uniref:DUF2490 domain-containing protein n=1 Tax=Novosphingobium sp. KCTC 2891 TaxID=2989730 RepID=UPI002223C0AC|nr:DUF2490 domain-containing protein [Novosphingobium sp. KCTC 2891]MCW1381756.1 DUF2490 domain-containing protein [Novosphingobium sp. KCTC 2891]